MKRVTLRQVSDRSGIGYNTVCRAFRPDGLTLEKARRLSKSKNPSHRKIAKAALAAWKDAKNSTDEDWRERHTRAKALREEHRLAAIKEMYLPADEVRAAVSGMIATAEKEFRRAFETELPAECEGLSAPEIRLRNRQALDRTIEKLHQRGERSK